jgi:hypothetical protein
MNSRLRTGDEQRTFPASRRRFVLALQNGKDSHFKLPYRGRRISDPDEKEGHQRQTATGLVVNQQINLPLFEEIRPEKRAN